MATASTVNAIPKMTSNTAPSGIVSASSFNALGQDPWKAFDSLVNSNWRSKNGEPLPQWLSYEFTSPIIISAYKVTIGSTFIYTPKSWTFEGSNDGSNWTVLDTRSNITNWSLSSFQLFNFSNTTAYKTYRINLIENNGGSFTDIYELEMYEIIFDNKFLILSEDSNYYSIKTSDPYLNLIPPMTSSTTPQGVVSSSSVEGANAAYKAFDNVFTGNGWIAANGQLKDQWLAYQFNAPTVINKYTITEQYEKSAAPRDWKFQGSNDGVNWTDLDTRTGVTGWLLGVKREFEFNNSKAYLIYRIFIMSNDGNTYYVSIGEMEMMINYIGLISIEGQTFAEDVIIKKGMGKQTTVDMNKVIPEKIFIDSGSEVLGSGRLFKKSIDTSKVTIKNVLIE
ncbi:hypothetical protein M2277_004931 [Paenibacillus sp. LBL]|uniref:discoidin domain-containing protein n=1 Tax=Paenibacillus sp. LBL TaxID=2940563 RepID=UPI002476A479|nr:discoidin domain-containing protein [Paenibacillus sp. LBL]MDH6674239.1 hypothetical protein [Paenibacillus sp. LBL]